MSLFGKVFEKVRIDKCFFDGVTFEKVWLWGLQKKNCLVKQNTLKCLTKKKKKIEPARGSPTQVAARQIQWLPLVEANLHFF